MPWTEILDAAHCAPQPQSLASLQPHYVSAVLRGRRFDMERANSFVHRPVPWKSPVQFPALLTSSYKNKTKSV